MKSNKKLLLTAGILDLSIFGAASLVGLVLSVIFIISTVQSNAQGGCSGAVGAALGTMLLIIVVPLTVVCFILAAIAVNICRSARKSETAGRKLVPIIIFAIIFILLTAVMLFEAIIADPLYIIGAIPSAAFAAVNIVCAAKLGKNNKAESKSE